MKLSELIEWMYREVQEYSRPWEALRTNSK